MQHMHTVAAHTLTNTRAVTHKHAVDRRHRTHKQTNKP